MADHARPSASAAAASSVCQVDRSDAASSGGTTSAASASISRCHSPAATNTSARNRSVRLDVDWAELDAILALDARAPSEPRKRELLEALDSNIVAGMASDASAMAGTGWIAYIWAAVMYACSPSDIAPVLPHGMRECLESTVLAWRHRPGWSHQARVLYEHWPEAEALLRLGVAQPALEVWLAEMQRALDMVEYLTYSSGGTARARGRRAIVRELLAYLQQPTPPPSLPRPERGALAE